MTWITGRDAALLSALLVAASLAASLHAVLRKRDPRSAVAWVGLVWLVPGLGPVLYALLGVNRVKRTAVALRRERVRATAAAALEHHIVPPEDAAPDHGGLATLARLGGRMSGRPLLSGNRVTPLCDGEEAYPAMLAAVEGATASVGLSSYIFTADEAGRRFVDALARAARRGVAVRVLVDGIGVRYGWPPVHRVLRHAGVPVARFLPPSSGAGLAFFNLRNHRKLLVVDGRTAFTGGMNIRRQHLVAAGGPGATRDVHFRLEGPAVGQLLATFADDWAFVTREVLEGPAWQAGADTAGPTAARVLTDGPDDDLDVIRTVLLGALAAARESVSVVTPYFVPDQPMVSALAVAALRGVKVSVVLPARGNIALVRWATPALLWQVLEPGCRVFLSPPPFDHAKLMVVDRSWSLVGSTNWDARSVRLNFELDVECYDQAFAAAVDDLVSARIAGSREITLAEADGRSLPTRVRDGVARLFSPYL